MNALHPSSNPQLRETLQGPVAILWDIENCDVPSDVRPEDVAGNIRSALRVHTLIEGNVAMFSAYGDFSASSTRLREGCQRTGVKLIDVPNGRKDAADKAILVDMFLFALDNKPPSSIMLISGDVDFSPALHILGQRGYVVILVIPSGVGVSSALRNAGRFVWDWPNVVRGEGILPQDKSQFPSRGGSNEICGCLRGCHISETQVEEEAKKKDEEEAIVNRGVSLTKSTSDNPITSTSRSFSLPSKLKEGTSYNQNESIKLVQPGDLNGLKGQLVKLLEMSGGFLPFTQIMSDYRKCYRRPLNFSDYGVSTLGNLFKKMSDAMIVKVKEERRFLYLRNVKAGPNAPNVATPKKRDKKGKGIQAQQQCSSLSLADEEKHGIVLKLKKKKGKGIFNLIKKKGKGIQAQQ